MTKPALWVGRQSTPGEVRLATAKLIPFLGPDDVVATELGDEVLEPITLAELTRRAAAERAELERLLGRRGLEVLDELTRRADALALGLPSGA